MCVYILMNLEYSCQKFFFFKKHAKSLLRALLLKISISYFNLHVKVFI